MFKRKRSQRQERQAAQEALASLISCFISDPNNFDVRSSVVLHDGQDPSQPIGVVNFGFSDDERQAVYMDGDLSVLVYQAQLAQDRPTAEAIALDWVGGGDQVDFRYLPGVYQAAYVQFITGCVPEPNETQFAWALPPVGDMHMFRKFPPPVDADTDENRNFVLMPRHAIDALWRTRGW
jgi:hypothetical protein